MSEKVRQLLDAYKGQLKSDPATADRRLPHKANVILSELLNQQLAGNNIKRDAVHLAQEASYFFGGDKTLTILALSRYLKQPLDVEEEAWARWNLVDNLAMLRRYEEVVDTQQEFLDWVKRHLTSDRLLWVMYDSTQAFCWAKVEKADEWFEIFAWVMETVVPCTNNRFDRFLYLRTAMVMYRELQRYEETFERIRELRELCQEDPGWERVVDVRINTDCVEIALLWKLQRIPELRNLGQAASADLLSRSKYLDSLNDQQRRNFISSMHNLGANFYFTQQYDLAVPVLRTAIQFDKYQHWTYLRLAASLWALDRSRPEVLALLRKCSELIIEEYAHWQTLPEFADVKGDAEFIAATSKT